MGRRFGLSLTALVLAGCAHNPGPPPVVDIAGLSCGQSIDLANPMPMALDPKKEMIETAILDGRSACLEEGGSIRSLYKVFALPVSDAPYIVMMTAQPWGGTILAPRLLLLDAGGKTLRSTTRADFSFRGNVLSAVLRSHADERYLVVASDAQMLGRGISRISNTFLTTIVPAGPVMFASYTGFETVSNLTLAPVGSISVSTSPFPVK